VLVSTMLESEHLSDTDLLRTYEGQPAVELSLNWRKIRLPSRPPARRLRPEPSSSSSVTLQWSPCRE
jgi:hypothetical protein